MLARFQLSGWSWARPLVVALCVGALAGHPALAQPAPGEDERTSEPFDPHQQQEQPTRDAQPATPPAAKPPASARPAQPKLPPATDHPGHAYFVRAADAVRQARAFSYHLSIRGTGSLGSRSSTTEADLWLVRASPAVLPGWHVRATGSTTSGFGGTVAFDVAWLESTVEWVDTEAKKVMERTLPEARKAKPVASASLARFDELTNAQPFKKELEASDYAIEERAQVGGVECDVVLATVNNGRLRVRWWLGAEDHLPRKSEALLSGADAGSRINELTGLRAGQKRDEIAPADLRVPIPEGFTEDRVVPAAKPVVVPPTPENHEPGGVAPSKPSAEVAPAKPSAPQLRMAPEFELTNAAGAKVSLATLRGKVAIAEFAGTWSLGVGEARRDFQALLDRYKGQALVGVSFAVRERSKDAAIDEYRQGGFTFDLLLEADTFAKSFGVSGFPSYALIGPEGELLKGPAPYRAGVSMEGLADAINAALAKLGTASVPDAPPPKEVDGPASPASGAPAGAAKPDTRP